MEAKLCTEPLASHLRATLAINPSAQALLFRGQWTTWQEIALIGAELDAHLARRLDPDVPVGLFARNAPAVVASLLALLSRGRTVWMLNPTLPDQYLAEEFDEPAYGAIIGLESDLDRVATAGVRDRVRTRVVLDEAPAIAWHGPDVKIKPSDIASGVVMQTSGTTGPPKRVMLSSELLWTNLSATLRHGSDREIVPRLRSGVVPLAAPIAHVGGLFGVLFSLGVGRRLALMEKFEPHAWANLIEEYQIQTSGLVPAAVRMVLDADIPKQALASLVTVRSGTAPLAPKLADEFEARYGVPIITSYGATEFGGAVTSMTIGDIRRWGTSKRGSVGRPHPGVTVRIADPETDADVLPGAIGILHVRQGDGLWHRTNDLAYLDEDGFLYIEGRIDDVINRGGFKVSLGRIEQELARLECVHEALAVGLRDPRLGEVPAAAVVLGPEHEMSGEALRSALRERMPAYMVPVRIITLDAFPRLVSMKVDKAAVRRALSEPSPA
jgi:long-chain acyl-CoA synthetase